MENANEVEDPANDSMSNVERGTDEILSPDSNEDIFNTEDNLSEACYTFRVARL